MFSNEINLYLKLTPVLNILKNMNSLLTPSEISQFIVMTPKMDSVQYSVTYENGFINIKIVYS
jgi:hypothetical protein